MNGSVLGAYIRDRLSLQALLASVHRHLPAYKSQKAQRKNNALMPPMIAPFIKGAAANHYIRGIPDEPTLLLEKEAKLESPLRGDFLRPSGISIRIFFRLVGQTND